MKTCFSVVLSFLLLLPVFDSAGEAAPRKATLFPNMAKVEDVARVALQPSGDHTFRAVITLPAQTVPDSLTMILPADSPLRIDDQNWRAITRQDDTRIAELRRQIQNFKTERNGVFSGIQALEAQVQFWQAQAKMKTKTVDEAGAFAALLTVKVKKALQEKLALEPELEKADKKLKELQEELNRITGQKETLWEVTFLLRGPPAREAILTLTYSLTGCGWTPLYRLEALPRTGTILFDWEADIWQSSGIDWNQVEIYLATLPPRSSLAPPDLPSWIIRPRPETHLKGKPKADLREAPAPRAMMLVEAQETAPLEIRQSTYSLWNLGKRNIPAGSRQRMKVRAETWPADFAHLLRPGLTSQAFIQAFVKLEEAKDVPSGNAAFLIDGALLGKRPFSFSGKEGNFFFGVDPLVTAETTLLSRKSGETGFIADRQTHEWVWRFIIRNARDAAVRVRMEDPLPQVRDERIKVFLKPEPEPAEKTSQAMLWKLEIPAGQTQSVLSTILLEAPKEMDLDLGWRR